MSRIFCKLIDIICYILYIRIFLIIRTFSGVNGVNNYFVLCKKKYITNIFFLFFLFIFNSIGSSFFPVNVGFSLSSYFTRESKSLKQHAIIIYGNHGLCLIHFLQSACNYFFPRKVNPFPCPGPL